ncbi:MAG TPA: TonB-dependent receptor plug domain-containing protein [Draconibacterium sp.]|nr:TonB-dependent receptor plug domain-containing protein [Draconibacterium sp.]
MFSTFTFGQNKTLTGKITAFDSIPLIGVNIMVKSTAQTVQSDSLGRFQVFCNPVDKLKINANGFFPKKVKITKDIRLILVNLSLKKGDNNLKMAERYVDIGYGHVNANRLLNAVSSLNNKDIDFSMYTDMYDLIQGQFPGVSVEGTTIIVRGTKTLYGVQGDAALIVIDGAIVTPQDFSNLSPLDVKSIDVLKDASASVYGSRGANGVVIVETKKGQ